MDQLFNSDDGGILYVGTSSSVGRIRPRTCARIGLARNARTGGILSNAPDRSGHSQSGRTVRKSIRLTPAIITAFVLTTLAKPNPSAAADPCNLPAWNGTVIIDCESTDGWSVEPKSGSSGTVEKVPAGVVGQAIRLNYELAGSGEAWAQARYDFDPPADLADFDLFGISLLGVAAPPETSNRIRIMVADTNDVFFEATIGDIAHVNRWMINMPLPRTLFTHVWWSPPGPIDWTQINRFFAAVAPPPPDTEWNHIQVGTLTIDHIQGVRSADWEAPGDFVPVDPDPAVAQRAVDYIVSQRCASTGLFRSWSGDPDAWAWLYDQALALLVLARERRWEEADQLAARLVQEQEVEGEQGHWVIGWNYCDPAIEQLDDWPGDQAWAAYALHRYAMLRGNKGALQASIRSGNWLAQQVRSDGCVDTRPRGTSSTEGNLDVWLAMMELGQPDDADRIAQCLQSAALWDDNIRYWQRGEEDPVVALNANTWVTKGFALHPRIDRADMARNALWFVQRTLATRSNEKNICAPEFLGLCGLDFEGPITLHAEGMGSYVVAGGAESQEYLETLKRLQRADGGVPGATEPWKTDTHWSTCWKGIAPTAWLYFAASGSPFVDAPNLLYVDANATGSYHDGSTWCNAFVYLQDALATAAYSNGVITEIRVADGVYRPDAGEIQMPGDRKATFQLLNGVALRGGYAGCGAPNPDERDVEGNETTLSGDLNGDDTIIDPGPGGGAPDDMCENAGPIHTGITFFDTTGATADGPSPVDCEYGPQPFEADIWYVYTHSWPTDMVEVSLCGSDFDTMVAVYEGDTCPPTTELACNDDACAWGGPSRVVFPATQGEVYLIRVGAYGGATGAGVINITCIPSKMFIGENSYHVVTGSETDETAVLDGVTVTGGNANGPDFWEQTGGGVLNDAGSPRLSYCRLTGNQASRGGAIGNWNASSPSVEHCTIIGNGATSGGGMQNELGSHPRISHCSFRDNLATDMGGGMHNWQSRPTLTNCDFIGNRALLFHGGGVSNEGGSNAELSDCRFVANRALERGGGMNNWESSPTLNDCIFSSNSAQYSGGINNDSNSNARLTRCVLAGNSARAAGGAMSNTNNSDVTLVNCLFVGNVTRYNGGAIDNWNRSDLLATNCTFSGNWSEGSSGIANWQCCGEATNCVIWGNTGPDGPRASTQVGGGPTFSYSCIQDEDPDDDWWYPGIGNIDDAPFFIAGSGGTWTTGVEYDPESGQTIFVDSMAEWEPDGLIGKFVNPDVSQFLQAIIVGNTTTEIIVLGDFSSLGTAGATYGIDDYRLAEGSPCINRGSNYAAELPSWDMDGDLRTENCRVDMGAYESPFAPTLFEDCNEDTVNDDCDVYAGRSIDWNENHAPDECDEDCNENGDPDFLDLLFGASEDCNDNEVPDECEYGGDCNENSMRDICDIAGGMSLTPFGTGFDLPQDIVMGEGCYPYGFLVPDAGGDAMYAVPWNGGGAQLFVQDLSWPIGAVLAPDEFGAQGERLFVVNEFGTDLVVVDCDGSWEPFAETSVENATGVEYVPLWVGGAAAGKLVVTGWDTLDGSAGKVFLVDSEGEWTMIVDGPGLWTPAFAPDGFGDFDHHIFVGQVNGPNLYALDLDVADPEDFELTRFAVVPFGENFTGLRQIAFSPPGWASSVDPTLANERVLLISVASGMGPGDPPGAGAIMAWDQRGRLVGVMRKGPDGEDFEPRGLRFKFKELLISDVTHCRGALLRASVDALGLPDCNDNGVLDGCEVDCNNNYVPDECEPITDGDFNANAIRDLADHQAFVDCLGGPASEPDPLRPECVDICRATFDFDFDGDVDFFDFGVFQRLCGIE